MKLLKMVINLPLTATIFLRGLGNFLVLLKFISLALISIFIVNPIYLSQTSHAEVRDFQKKGIKLLYHIRSFQPGEAFMLEVEVPKAAHTIKGTLFDKDLSFYADGLIYRAIGGIDFRSSPGDYELNLTVSYRDGEISRITDILSVKKKVFEIRKISVNEGYVNLSEGNKQRVAKEQKEIKTIFTTSDTEKLWDKDFDIPLQHAEYTSGFGVRRIINGKQRSPHTGVDLRASEGTSVYSSNSGRVVFADDFYYSGKTVILNHGMGVYTIYAHLSNIKVKKEQIVEKGDPIGLVGATGRVTGPHLHWGAKVMGSIIVDPLSLKNLLLR